MVPSVVAALLREEYQEMADVVLLCECAHEATVFYQPDPLYEYRRHPQQVPERMDHSKEDRLQAYLLEKTEGSPLERKVRRNLEKRRADRCFSWAWDKGRFREYPFRLDFSWKLALRPLRNRKKMALTILIREIGDRLRSWAATRRQA